MEHKHRPARHVQLKRNQYVPSIHNDNQHSYRMYHFQVPFLDFYIDWPNSPTVQWVKSHFYSSPSSEVEESGTDA